MKIYDSFSLILMMILTAAAVFLIMHAPEEKRDGQFFVDVNRIEMRISAGETVSADEYDTVSAIVENTKQNDFFDSGGTYVIREINGTLYRIDRSDTGIENRSRRYTAAVTAVFWVILAAVLIYIRQNIIKPFDRMKTLPYELSKGNLTIPLAEQKNRFFGKFLWGLDMLREKLEESGKRELENAKNEKTLLLSLSHDIKTPLSGIKLNAKALSKGIYHDPERRKAAADSIGTHADEIEKYVNEMIEKLSDGGIEMEVNITELYLDDVISPVTEYYSNRFSESGTDFSVGKHTNCILNGDPGRLMEVIQNILENAVKYGDGIRTEITFSDEEECRLITVTNSGCTLDENELSHIFDSFWRGSNAQNKQGSGLGLFICRKLMHAMGGDIFAEISGGNMSVTAVCRKCL